MKSHPELTYAGRSLSGRIARDATIYHSDQWLTALSSYFGYKAAPAILESGQEVVALAPLVEINNMTGKKLRTPPASMYGQVLSDSSAHREALIEMLKARSHDARQKLIVKVAGDDEIPLTELSREIDCRIPLDDKELAWKRLHASARRGVRKSQREGVVVTAELPESFNTFFDLLVATRRRLGLPVAPRAWTRSILDSGHAGLLIARQDGIAVAGILYLKDPAYVHYALPAYSDAGTRIHGLDACIWTLIERYCDGEQRWLGMGGSPELNQGLRRFKTKWGGEERIMRLLSDVPQKSSAHRGSSGQSSLLRYAPGFMLQALGYTYLRYLQ